MLAFLCLGFDIKRGCSMIEHKFFSEDFMYPVKIAIKICCP